MASSLEPDAAGGVLRDWAAQRLAAAPGRVGIDLVVGGRSNMTWRIDLDGQPTWVLRHPPLGNHVQGGHDVVREGRIVQALAGGQVPVPSIVEIAEDSPLGVPVVVMEHVRGDVLRTPADVVAAVPPQHRTVLARRLVEALVAVHEVDPDRLPIRTSTRTIAERQLTTWLEQSRREGCAELDLIEEAQTDLRRHLPETSEPRLIHGDFRLENCLIDADCHEVSAVLDWELATVGDPLADVGLLLAYWAEPDDEVRALHDPPTVAPGMATRDDVVGWYLSATGRSESALRYYEALGWWKLACIVGGVHARIRRGVFAPPDRTEASYAEQGRALAVAARTRAAALGT